ncbi:MAG: hypothetical protein VB858_07980, partial [Planctomycetaceae bacterium]
MSSNTLYCNGLPRFFAPDTGVAGVCRRSGIGFLAALTILIGASSGAAQEDAASDNTAATEEDSGPLERLIYLPYRNLKEVFAKHGSTVFMPYAEYLKLWQQTQTVEQQAVEGVITESHYTARVDQSL